MDEPVFGVCLRGETHGSVVSPSMIETVMSSQNASGAFALDQALQNVFGDRSLVRNLQLIQNREISDDVSGIIGRKPFVNDFSTAISRAVQRNTSNLVSFSRSLVDQTPWERESSVAVPEGDNQSTCDVDLFALVSNFVGHNLTTILLGEAFMESFPGFLRELWALDSSFVSLFVGTPRWLPIPWVSSGYAARDRLLRMVSVFYQAFTAWDDGIDPGIELRELDDVSELVKERMRTFRKLGLSPSASAAGHVSFLWDVIEHTSKITFWTVSHIFADSELLKEIRKEILPYVQSTRPSLQETGFPFEEPPHLSLDLEKVLQECPLLNACYYEAVRLHSAEISFRILEKDLTLSESAADATEPRTYKIRKGEKVIMPHGVYQHDPQRFSNPEQYDPLRFIVTDSDTGAKKCTKDGLAPFADGLYGSKSNNLTERSILAFIATFVSMWDIKSTDGRDLTVPAHRPTWGAFPPAKDVRVQLKMTV